MPQIIAAARARASEGEMVAALQRVFGTYTEHPSVLAAPVFAPWGRVTAAYGA